MGFIIDQICAYSVSIRCLEFMCACGLAKASYSKANRVARVSKRMRGKQCVRVFSRRMDMDIE